MIRDWAPASLLAGALVLSAPAATREITWDDIVPPLQRLLSERGVTRTTFSQQITEIRRQNQARVREGDLDHLVYYALQSSAFTSLLPIEPAVSAAEFVGRLTAEERSRFLAGDRLPGVTVPGSVAARFDAFATAVHDGGQNARLTYFREILARERPDPASLRAFLSEQYVRAMRFLYEQGRAAHQDDQADATGKLYQVRGLSTDTSAEAGYLVYLALATLKQLEPQRRIRRALIVGPGLDLAPRTGLSEASDPQSYQPFAVIDGLLGLGLAERDRLRITAVDINPRVVDWLSQVRGTRPRLAIVSGVVETDRVRLTGDYRAYFAALGRAIGLEQPLASAAPGRPSKSITLSSGVTDAIDAATADITIERLDQRYDLIVVTNVFPYLSDSELLLALTNIVGMLAPGGVLLHNESRPLLAQATEALHLALIHSRSAVIATVEGRSPLYDAVWMHRAPGIADVNFQSPTPNSQTVRRAGLYGPPRHCVCRSITRRPIKGRPTSRAAPPLIRETASGSRRRSL